MWVYTCISKHTCTLPLVSTHWNKVSSVHFIQELLVLPSVLWWKIIILVNELVLSHCKVSWCMCRIIRMYIHLHQHDMHNICTRVHCINKYERTMIIRMILAMMRSRTPSTSTPATIDTAMIQGRSPKLELWQSVWELFLDYAGHKQVTSAMISGQHFWNHLDVSELAMIARISPFRTYIVR